MTIQNSKLDMLNTKYKMQNANKGQTLLEILVVSIIIGIVAASAALLVNTAINIQKKAKKAETAAKLLKEARDAARSMAEKNWPYYISTTTDGVYYKIASTTSGWVLQTGKETFSKDNMTFTRYVVFNDVQRNFTYPDFLDNIVSSGGTIDPSTKKLTVYVTSTENFILSASEYIARYWNAVWTDTDWSGGSTVLATATAPLNTFATSTNINYATVGEIKINVLAASATGTLISHIYDLGSELNAETIVLNSVTWKGDGCSATGCKVSFRIASATSSTAGPWEESNFLGYDGSSTWYDGIDLTAGTQTKQIKIRRLDFNNKRYFRYKIMLQASADGLQSPVVRDVIFNWSR